MPAPGRNVPSQGRWSLAAALAAGGLALHAAALWRAHVLLAGPRPSPGVVAGGAVALVLVLGRTKGASRLAAAAFAALVLVAQVIGPLVVSRVPSAAGVAVLFTLAALPGLALAWSGRRPLAASALGAGLGALGAALLLPFAGPFLLGLVGAALGALGLALAPRDPGPEAPAREPLALLGILAGAALALPATVVLGDRHPWPSWPARAGFLALGLALGVVLARRARRPALGAALAVLGAALATAPAWPAVRERLDAWALAWAMSPTRPAVGVAGGLLTLLAIAAIAGLVAGAFAGLAAGAAPRRGVALGALAFVAAGLALQVGWQRPEVTAAEPPSRERLVTSGGRLVAWDSPKRLPDDLLAAHAGALLAAGRTRGIALGWDPAATLGALRLHGFDTLLHGGPVDPERVGLSARDDAWRRVRSARDLERLGPFDVVVSQLDDPALPESASFFTRAAHEAVRRSLLPGGVFVQRLDLEQLGPEGLLREVLLLRETFPDTWIMTADMGRGGVLAVCLGAAPALPDALPAPPPRAAPPALPEERDAVSREPALEGQGAAPPKPGTPLTPLAEPEPPEPARLPSYAALVSSGRVTPDIARSLRDARLLDAEALLATFAAGPAEIGEAAARTSASDPWAPGSLAFRHPAPPAAARELAQALLYSRIAAVDVRFEERARDVGGTHPQGWDFLGIDTRLGGGWREREAVIRHVNTMARVFGAPALSRTSARRMGFVAPGRRLEIRQHRIARADRATLASALAELEGPAVLRTGGAVVHGHPALWLFSQPTPQQQQVALAWHCPVQGAVYVAELDLAGGVKPGLYEEPLRVLTDDLRCRHPSPAGATPPAGATSRAPAGATSPAPVGATSPAPAGATSPAEPRQP